MIEWSVPPDQAGARLDAWLSARPEIGSRARARAWIERGKLFLNGAELAFSDAGRRLRAGDRIQLWEDRPGSARRASRELARARRLLRIVYEDGSIVIADKPAGLLVEPLPGEGNDVVTLLDLIADHLRTSARARALVVHRIDRDTSGLVVFAKGVGAQDGLKKQFERRTPERIYLAVLQGRVRPAGGTWIDRLVWDTTRLRQTRAHPREARAKEAIARYRVLEQFEAVALVEVTLVTGKRNQIRVQAGIRGHPVVGERLYTYGSRPPAPGQPTLERQALHAHRLVFRHPTTGARVDVVAPIPDDFARLVARLRALSAAGRPERPRRTRGPRTG